MTKWNRTEKSYGQPYHTSIYINFLNLHFVCFFLKKKKMEFFFVNGPKNWFFYELKTKVVKLLKFQVNTQKKII